MTAQEAQPNDNTVTPPARQPIDIEPIERSDSVDLLIETPEGPVDRRSFEQCESEQDASTISGEIVVCRELVEDNLNYYSGSREDALRRYAQETQYADVIATPDVAGPGIFKGQPTIGGLCIPGLQKCPPPPALIIDVTALPQAPAGSDADRIARGLPPLGANEERVDNASGQLGLPDPAVGSSPASESPANASLEESEAPKAAQ